MTFLNPLALLGLFAATIPIILHLLNLRKLKTVEFSSLRFLKELQKTKIRRFKIKQIILLILRTLIIISAVIAFSRPTIEKNLPLMGQYAKTSAVILIDNSFSMDLSDELGNRFNQAKNATISVLNSFKDGDEATIIQMTDPEKISLSSFTRNISMLKDDLSKIKISYQAAKLLESLRLAEKILENSTHLNKEIYVITDAQNNIFFNDLKDSLKIMNLKSTLYFIPIGINSRMDYQNLSIDSINLVTKIFQINKPIEIETFIRNTSNKSINSTIVSMFFNNQRVAQRSFDIQANELKSIQISASPQSSGIFNAHLEIENDALDIDNKRFFGFIIQDKPKVAIFGSKPSMKFLDFALKGTSSIESPAAISEFSSEEMGSKNLNDYDIAILSGGKYSDNDFKILEQYVKSGGNAIIFANDETDKDIFKNGIASLGFGYLKEVKYDLNQPAGFVGFDKIHPLFQGVFKGTTDNREMIESPQIEFAYPVENGQPIIQMTGGLFLSENRLDEGKVFYFAVSPTINWSNFPLTGLFPTIIYRSIFYLTTKENQGINAKAGTSVILKLPKTLSSSVNIKITDPNNNEFYQEKLDLPGGSSISMKNLDYLGNYIISNNQGKPYLILSVNPENSESIITKVDKSEIGRAHV